MKRQYKKRIFVELIILCFLFIVWILWGDKGWLVQFINYAGKKISAQKENINLTHSIVGVFTFILIVIGFIFIIFFRKSIPEWIKERGRKPTAKPSPLSILEVENIKDFEEMVNKKPFVENLAVGKEIKEKKTWSNVKEEIDFSRLQPIDLSLQYRVFFITGKPGAGKSTYTLWSLDEYLRNKKMFNKIIFLNPDAYEQWAEDLYKYDSRETLLVVDALRRDGDTDKIFKKRCSCLFRLAVGEERIGEKIIGPFKVITTIRDDEYNYLARQKEFSWIADSAFLYEITPEKLDLKRIVVKYLKSYNVRYEGPEDKRDAVIEQLISKSGGLPFYIRHVVADLKATNSVFSEGILEEYPHGMVNLIWQVIRKAYYIENDHAIPFLLLLLLETDKGFSSHYFSFVIEKLSPKREAAFKKAESLTRDYLQRSLSIADLKNTESFSLDSHWKLSLRTGLEQPEDIRKEYWDAINFYKRIKDEQFYRLRDKIATDLKTHLRKGFTDKADIFWCVDLAKMGEENLEAATNVYFNFHSLCKLPQGYIKYVQEELYELWIINAWKYRSSDYHDPKDVIRCYENAFDKLDIRSHLKQLSAYAYYLQTRVLPKCKYGTPEFQQWKEKIENLHDEVIRGQSEQGIKDPISYQTLALFYGNVGEDEKAEKTFEGSLKIGPSHIPTRQAYAIFLKGRGKREWVRDRTKALEYYRKAEEQFVETIKILEDEKKRLLQKEIEEFEKKLLTAYAIFLIDKTEWERELDKRIKIDTEVDELFDKLLGKYPNHGQSINVYARFLMGYGRILPKYKGGGKNLRKAEKLLNDFIKVERNKKEKALSYFMALHILAVYCYRQEPAFYRQSPDLEKVERLLKDSSKSFSSYHNSIAYNELGLLYVRWGNNLQKNGDSNAYNEKMNMAKEAYEKAMEIVPENQQSALHLSRVYFNYAFYSQYMGQTEQSETYIQKALEVTKKFAYIPFNHYYSLTALGDEILKDHDIDMGMRVFLGAKQLGERLQINPWYAIYKLGEIYKEKQDINQALEFYLQSAQLENTSEGYGTRRDSIKQLMKDYSIRKDRNTTLYKKCIKVRVECSKKAYELKPDDHKNCGDYGEDLKEREAFNDAIPILEKGANFIPQDSELTEDKKMEKLNWLYQEIGHCYIFLRDDTKAEEFFDKSAKAEDSAIGYFKHAGRMSDLNKHDKTVNSYKKFIDKFPSSPKDKKEKIFKDMAKTLKKIAGSYENLLKEDESVLAWKDYADVSFYSNPESDGRECGIAGNKLLKIHKFLEARECFLKSIRLEPKSAQNLSQLGYINKILQKWEECMICSERAISIRINLRDKYQYDFCQEEHNKNPKVYDTNKIDDLINLSIIEELKGQHNEALVYYKNALTLLMGQESQDENTISKYRFIADAFWILGMRDDALKLYEEKIKDLIVGHERIVVEAIIWFMSSKSLER